MSRDTLKMLHDAQKYNEPEPLSDRELFQRCLESLIFKYTVAEKHELIDLLLAKVTELDKPSCKRCEKNYF